MRALSTAAVLAAVMLGACIDWDEERDLYCDAGGGGCEAVGDGGNTDGGNGDAGQGALTSYEGDGQATQVGAVFPTQLSVQAFDADGQPLGALAVTFSAPLNGASGNFEGARSVTVVTGSDGIATAPVLTANSTVGAFSVVASADGVSDLVFQLSNTERAPFAVELVAGGGQIAGPDEVFSAPVLVKVTDAAGEPFAGATVQFSGPASGPGMVFLNNGATSIQVPSGANGEATPGPVRAATVAGDFAVTVSVLGGNVPEASVPLTVRPGGPAVVVLIAGNLQFTQIDTDFSLPLVAELRDSFDNPIPGQAMRFANGTDGAGCIFSNGASEIGLTTGDDGRVTDSCHARPAAGAYTVLAESLLNPTVFDRFELTATVADHLEKAFGDNQVTSGTTFDAVGVIARDAIGRAVPNASVTFSIRGTPTASFDANGSLFLPVQCDGAGVCTSSGITCSGDPQVYPVEAQITGSGPETVQTFTLTAE